MKVRILPRGAEYFGEELGKVGDVVEISEGQVRELAEREAVEPLEGPLKSEIAKWGRVKIKWLLDSGGGEYKRGDVWEVYKPYADNSVQRQFAEFAEEPEQTQPKMDKTPTTPMTQNIQIEIKKPHTDEFCRFINLLLQEAPNGYIPWIFKLKKGAKDPIEGISWKSKYARLDMPSAIAWMNDGGNIGIAGLPDDPLVNMDADGGIIPLGEIKQTLLVRTRSRVGCHAFYFSANPKIPNIPTDKAGEVRSQWQYVVAAGSYVSTDPATVPENERPNAGYYTIENARPAAWITYSELPKVFRDTYEKAKNQSIRKPSDFDPKAATGPHSALFDLTAKDIVIRFGKPTDPTKRWGSIFHDSTTDENMSISNGLLHCWRHNRSFNALQVLVVLSGYLSCNEAGTPHKGAGAGQSQVVGNNGAIFHAWLYAKKNGYIPVNDPIPVKAMHYIAQKHLNFEAEENKPLPHGIYRHVLKIVEDEY